MSTTPFDWGEIEAEAADPANHIAFTPAPPERFGTRARPCACGTANFANFRRRARPAMRIAALCFAASPRARVRVSAQRLERFAASARVRALRCQLLAPPA